MILYNDKNNIWMKPALFRKEGILCPEWKNNPEFDTSFF